MKKLLSILLALTLLLCVSVTAFAESEGEVTVNGTIQNTNEEDPLVPIYPLDPEDDTEYDITFTAAVYWWVTNDSYPNVVDGDANGPDASVENVIENNNASSQIEVAFVSFEGTNQAASDLADAGTLELYLTGDLALTSDPDISGDYSTAETYSDLIAPGDIWTYGFSGEYSEPLSRTAIEPTYALTLSFAFA